MIGRRRVGKTFLIRTFFQERIVFDMTGIRGISTQQQLGIFSERLREASGAALPVKQLTDWFEAFRLLQTCIKPFLSGEEKKVIFLDERPWLDGEKSDFVSTKKGRHAWCRPFLNNL